MQSSEAVSMREIAEQLDEMKDLWLDEKKPFDDAGYNKRP
jgi:hypothetical protein